MSLMTIAGLSKSFGGVSAVNNVGINVEAGEIFAVIGPNGAGKTTLFNLITGVLPPTSGTICFDGEHIGELPAYKRAQKGIARTFQNLQLFYNMSVVENVMAGFHLQGKAGFIQSGLRLPMKMREERKFQDIARELLGLVGLEQLAEQQSANLSFGQQRLLEISRAMALEPKLLLLDEPVAGLNSGESKNLMDLIVKLRNRGMTVLLVEHDMNTVMNLSTRIAVLVNGEKIAEGDPGEIQADEKVITAYLGEEASGF